MLMTLTTMTMEAQENREDALNDTFEEVGTFDENGLKTGVWKTMKEDHMVMKTIWSKGRKHGKWTKYHADGSAKSQGEFNQGKRNGEWLYYSEEGMITNTAIYSTKIEEDDSTKSTTTVKVRSYYSNGKLERVGEWESGVGADGKEKYFQSGEWKAYRRSGQLFEVCNWSKGLMSGKCTLYFDNGNLKDISHWKEGVQHGKWEQSHENGKKSFIGSFENGHLNGRCKQYFESGQLKTIGAYANGKKTGEWKVYYQNSQLKEIGSLLEGEKVGEWNHYDEKGVLLSKEEY